MKLLVMKVSICLFIVLGSISSFAQKDVKKYKEDAEAIRKEVWAWTRPEFKVRTVPEKYANVSSVIIARHIDINADSKKKVAFTGLGFASYRALNMTEIVRELVKLNDKSAVDEYSEIGYTQMEKKSGFIMNKTTLVYVGIRVIKADGSMKEVNADDIVLTKDEKRTKEAKAAVPDLQIGDMIDYFIAKQTSMEQQGIPPYTFTFFDNSPILNYSIHCDVGSKYAVEYRCYNGAPDFKRSQGEGESNVLEVIQKNIPAYPENSFWVSPYRQLPIIRMNIMLGYNGLYSGRMNARKPGEVYRNQASSEFIEDEMNSISMAKMSARTARSGSFLEGPAEVYIKKLKKSKDLSTDELAAELYYAFRFDKFLDIVSSAEIEDMVNYSSRSISPSAVVFYMSSFFKTEDVDNQLILLTSKYGPDMKSIMSKDDIAYLMLVQGSKPRVMGITDVFSPAFFIPSHFETTKEAVTLDTKGTTVYKTKSFDQGKMNIPASPASQNIHIEKMTITPSTSTTEVKVNRSTTLKGHYKNDVQKELILFEDYYESERKIFGVEKTIQEKLKDSKKTKKYADEVNAAFAEARKKQKDAFVSEAKSWLDLEVKELSGHKIENMGVRHNSPDFIYSSQFSIPGLLKKAGNNYIMDIGKLQGSPLKVENHLRKRTLDVYAPFARSMAAEFTVEIPEGFTAEGVANLNTKVENDCGSFISEATLEGNNVKIKLQKIYKNTYEPVGNWEKLLAIIDAANEWSNAKLLLKKK